MLAEVGFITTGVCFAAFAYTFKTLVIDKTKLRVEQFTYAYYCLALALVTWGIAVAIGGDRLLKNSVLTGDLFLLLGTVFMLDLLIGHKNKYLLWLSGAVALVLFNFRAQHYPPVPHMQNGILFFNTQRPVAVGLAALFILVWLPANLRVAKMITYKIKQQSLASYYSYIYVAATISALVFISARKALTVVLSFVALGVCFLMLIASNFLVEIIKDSRGSR